VTAISPLSYLCLSIPRCPSGTVLCVNIEHKQDNTMPENEYYHDQIIGLQVMTTDGELIGAVTDILSGTSNDNYIVRGSAGEVLIPAIEDVIQSIDLDKGIIIIEAIKGLLDLNDNTR
jgi:16S rRNA processing protein RimM